MYICTFGFRFGIRPKARCFSGQIFSFGLKWKTHFRSFTGDLRFVRKDSLVKHISAVHEGKKISRYGKKIKVLYKCNLCTVEFDVHRDLKMHLSTVHDDKKLYNCKICDLFFTREDSLVRHTINVHEKIVWITPNHYHYLLLSVYVPLKPLQRE